jgi:hypothetical protein
MMLYASWQDPMLAKQFSCDQCGADLSRAGFEQRVAHAKKCVLFLP